MALKSILFNDFSMDKIRRELKTNTRRIALPEFRYAVGDILWCREAWLNDALAGVDCFHYRADDTTVTRSFPAKLWRNNLFMPKKVCREWLEVVAVRKERLWEINQKGAEREGAMSLPHRCDGYSGPDEPWCRPEDRSGIFDCLKCGYRQIWNSIYKPVGPKSTPDEIAKRWEANPEVEVIAFKRIPKPEGWPL